MIQSKTKIIISFERNGSLYCDLNGILSPEKKSTNSDKSDKFHKMLQNTSGKNVELKKS